MCKTYLSDWLPPQGRGMTPPGCETVFAPSPCGYPKESTTIGIVHEHRFAFYYWASYCAQEDRRHPPALLTLDSHNDVGADSYTVLAELDNLNLRDETMLGLYSWLRLPSLNDGHILPALHLNIFADVYVLLSRRANRQRSDDTIVHIDKYGDPHRVCWFKNEDRVKDSIPDDQDIYLDIDLDFFADPNVKTGCERGSENPWKREEIRRFLRRKRGLVQHVLPSVVGMTIALEPSYCGGFCNSLRILDAVNQELFDGTLGTNRTKWKSP